MFDVDVEKMDIVQCFGWLEDRGITAKVNSLKEMKDLIRSTLRSRSNRISEHLREKMNAAFVHALELDKDMKQDLAVIYTALINEMNSLQTDVQRALQAAFGNDYLKLSENRDKLLRMNCIILVAGETSAGKTSFLNLMLEDDVFPTEHLPSTSVICRIHPIKPGAERYFEIDFHGKKSKRYTEKNLNKQSMLAKLKRKVTSRSPKYDNAIVDIYWQIPLLGENDHVTIVDTPGVGETDSLSEKLFKYLPNATAFIYILNSPHAGGVHEDRLGLIFQKMEEVEESDDLFRIDSSCMMFVCNKWDIVEENASPTPEKLLDDILKKLRKYAGKDRINLNVNVFTISTDEARRYLDNNSEYIESYQRVLDGLRQLIVAGQAEHSKRHFRCLESRVNHILTYCKTRRDQAGTDRKTQQIRRRLAEQKLGALKMNTQQVKKEIREFCKHQCENIAKAFHDYIRSLKQVFTQQIEEFIQSHTYDDYDELRSEVKRHIFTIVCESLTDDIGAITMAKQAIEEKFTKKFYMLEKDLQDVILDLRCGSDDTSFLSGPETTRQAPKSDFSFTTGAKVAIGLTAPIWIPIGAAFTIVGLLFAIPAVAISGLIDRRKLDGIYTDPSKQSKIWLEETLDECFHKGAIQEMVDQRVMVRFRRQIDTVFDYTIPGMIKSQEILLNGIASDTRSAEHIKKVFIRSIANMNSVAMKLNVFKAKYNS